jgi:hypothetical protein
LAFLTENADCFKDTNLKGNYDLSGGMRVLIEIKSKRDFEKCYSNDFVGVDCTSVLK